MQISILLRVMSAAEVASERRLHQILRATAINLYK
jgi:hypothetical protein